LAELNQQINNLNSTDLIPTINGICASIADNFCAPAAGLCTAGTPTDISGTGPWTWTCEGTYGGNSAQCTANKISSMIYTTPGTYSWTIPSCLSAIDVEVIGAGGGGGGGSGGYMTSSKSVNGGYGGSAGSRTVSNILTSALGSSVTIIVGAGGNGGGAGPSPTLAYHPGGGTGSTGNASSFNGTVSAPGGAGGGGGSSCWSGGCSPMITATVGSSGFGTGITGNTGQNGQGPTPGPGASGGTGYGSGGGGGGYGDCCTSNSTPGGNGGTGAPGRVMISVP
jgi:hypothetical protein